jgi:peptidoglycan hydrolase-like protein with peptidoglycan-binding domain
MAIVMYKKGSTTKVSTNFRANEFDCQGRGCCSQTPIDTKLVAYLQDIRDHFKKPVIITAYRCPVHNVKVANAASRSYHTYGQAADFHIDGVSPAEIAKYAESIGVLGIGLYDSASDGHFVHIDTRTSKSFWKGHAQVRVSTFGGAVENKPVQNNEYSLTQFIKDVQAACGATVDGIAGSETLSKTVTVSAKKNNTHKVVLAIQKRLLALGYKEVGATDVVAGAKFTAAVKAFQKANGCWADGEVTAKNKTWKKLLGM